MRAQRRYDRRPERDVGYEIPVHHVEMIQSAPAAATSRTSSPSLEKSDESIDGAMTTGLSRAAPLIEHAALSDVFHLDGGQLA